MATGAKNGLSPSRKFGSAPNGLGITEYNIANSYATSLYKGDLVKVGTGGTIEIAAAGDDAIGVFLGCAYTKSDGTPTEAPYWPASTSSATTPTAKIDDSPASTYTAVGNASVSSVKVGDLYDLVIGTGSTLTGNSAAQVDITGGVVLIAAAHVKVVRVINAADNVLEVQVANHDFRDDG